MNCKGFSLFRATKKLYFDGDDKKTVIEKNKKAKSLANKTIDKDLICNR